MMNVSFKATLDDFTEATFHSLKRRRRLRPWHRRLSTYAVLLLSVIAGRFLAPTEILKLAAAIPIAIPLLGLDEFLYRRLIYRRSRDFHLRKLGFKLPLPYEVHLSESGLKLVEGGEETDLPWAEVASVEQIRERIFVNERDGSVTVIPFSAFQSEADRERFFNSLSELRERPEKSKG
jgi:hypothetical protein